MRLSHPLILTLALAGCNKYGEDADLDGYPALIDCADDNDTVYPGAPEACDGVDNNCDGVVDEPTDEAPIWYADADEDGYGAAAYGTRSCEQPEGYVDNAEDCNDLNARSFPAAEEWCDLEDNDCDGEVDEEALDVDAWYVDADGDGYGDPVANPLGACSQPDGYVDNNDDCDDRDEDRSPETYWFSDFDGDGYGSVTYYLQRCEQPDGYADNPDDCDDLAEAVNPGAAEICDTIDNDCDDDVDDADGDVTDQITWYEDADADGYGDDATAVVACFAPPNHVPDPGDCDDDAASANPSVAEVCDGTLDNNCDGEVDEGCPVLMSTATVTFVGAYSSDYAGYEVTAGDFNGDGVDDVAFGAYGSDNTASSAGSAYIFYGPYTAGTYSVTTANQTFNGSSSSDYLGYSMSATPDFNGDGRAELFIGAYGADAGGSSSGSAYLFNGGGSGTTGTSAASVTINGHNSSDYVGQYAQVAASLNGDNNMDLVVGAHGNDLGGSSAGAIFGFFGPLSGTVSTSSADLVIAGATSSDYVGYNVNGSLDLSGDGVADLAFGASGEPRAYIMHGPITAGTYSVLDSDVAIAPAASSDGTGSNLTVGDYNNDGYNDVAIGAKYDNTGGSSAGAVYVLNGPVANNASLATDAVFSTYEVTSLEYLGANYNSMETGDIDGDGNDDLVLGSYSNSTTASSSGAVFGYYGPLSGAMPTTDADIIIGGEGSAEYVGYGVGIGDFDNDGMDDLAVGGRGYNSSAGRLAIFYGADL